MARQRIGLWRTRRAIDPFARVSAFGRRPAASGRRTLVRFRARRSIRTFFERPATPTMSTASGR
jgi:hypothetical protein